MQAGTGKGVPRYRAALAAISARTGTALPSLITSFAILHEATAVAPLIAVFYAARSAGIGEQVVQAVRESTSAASENADEEYPAAKLWLKQTGREWLDEGEQWVGRVGRRYGIWGFDKRKAGDPSARDTGHEGRVVQHVAGDVANAMVAYGVTKAILPVRIGLSLYLSPGFARAVVSPVSARVLRIFRRQ